jgi:cell division protein FtsI (penicillin-binding protein 3)
LTSVTTPEGTGTQAALADFRVAGKTGTAQKVNPETHRYDPHAVVSSFIGFVPAESPKFVLLVVVDDPKGPGWGGTVAAPAFRQIANATLNYLGVMPSLTPSDPKLVKAGPHIPTDRPRRSPIVPVAGGPLVDAAPEGAQTVAMRIE